MRYLGTVQGFLALVILVVFVGALWLMLKNDVAPNMRDALLIMVGALGSAFGAVVNYYFGSSSGSAVKTGLLSEARGHTEVK